jgi:hypothetical protein
MPSKKSRLELDLKTREEGEKNPRSRRGFLLDAYSVVRRKD